MLTIGVASQAQSVDAAQAARKQWLTSGNANTDPTTNFIGTTDNQPLVFKTNGKEVMRLGTDGNLTMEDDNLTLKLITISDGNDQSRFEGRRARGVPGAPTIVQSGDNAVIFRGRGWDGDSYRQLGDIRIRVDGTPGDDDMPGRIEFRTTPDGDDSSQRRMVIKNTGNVGIGPLSNPQRILHIDDVMRLEPRVNRPTAAAKGDIYVDNSGALCFYDGGSWSVAAGGGNCLDG